MTLMTGDAHLVEVERLVQSCSDFELGQLHAIVEAEKLARYMVDPDEPLPIAIVTQSDYAESAG